MLLVLTSLLPDPHASPILVPEVLLRHPGLRVTDATGREAESLPPDPNLVLVEVRGSAEALAAVEADEEVWVVGEE